MMARLFLSYARDDAVKAQRIARALERAGHSVWWDRQLHAGSRFTAEIDAALHNAEAVVVLWSRTSVTSAWVQDEAAAGRDKGCLFPVLLEAVMPPLGFRQYHAADFSDWSGRGKPRALPGLIDALGAAPRDTAKASFAPLTVGINPRRALPILLGGIAFLLIAAALTWTRLGGHHAPTLSISASRSGASPASADLAHQVALDMTRFQPARLESLTVLDEPDSSKGVDYRAELGVNKEDLGLGADLSLIVKGRPGVSWVDKIEGSASHEVDLRQQAAATLANVLGCAIESDASPTRLSNADYRLFLDGCAALSSQFTGENSRDLAPVFKKITASAPDFAPAQAMFVLAQVNAISTVPAYQRAERMRDARAALKRAKALDPSLEEVFAAEASNPLADKAQWSRTFPILDRGLQLHPDSAVLLGLRADRLMSLGRMAEAVDDTRQALGFDPLAPQVRVNFINALAYSDQVPAARSELAKADATWPRSALLAEARYRLDLRYGDSRAALSSLKNGNSGNSDRIALNESWEKFLLARINPSPPATEAALESFRQRYRHDPADIPGYLQALGTFGRTDEAFQVTANPDTIDSLQASTDILFRPHMKSLVADPRFMRLANDLGLLAFWRSSNVWPDFCSDPKLPYDCSKEAAKYRN